ncbi:MAG: BMP family ABC transporter substrate-binding protein [Alsobacter sp.]
MSNYVLTRRSALLSGAAGLVAAATSSRAFAAPGLTVGLIYVGPKNDYGWNQSHALAARALKEVPGVKVLEEENVPETDAVVKTIESMIQLDGAKLIFGTSFGYFDPFMIALAKKYPDVEFRHPVRLWKQGVHPDNLGSYAAYVDQGHYVNGIAAGLSTKSNKIGYIIAKPISVMVRAADSFALGVRKVNPNATVRLVVTGDFSNPIREAEATNTIADSGCDVVAFFVDNPKVILQNAEQRGLKSCGHNTSQADLAPKGFITGAECHWETVYKGFADLLAKGQKLPNVTFGGYDKDYVRSSAFGPGASPEAVAAATKAVADLKAGSPIFVAPIKDNTGKLIFDKTLSLYDPVLDGTNFLVEGLTGSLT